MSTVELQPPTPSGGWPPKTGAVPSPVPGFATEIAWTADRGWMSSSEHAGSPADPPPDAEGVTVVLPEEDS